MKHNKRLIDATEFIKTFWQRVHDGEIVTLIDAEHAIINAHTVDAKEVVHGRWVNPYINRYGHPCHCCSVCGFKASYQDKNYCPNCGAKMDW